MASKAAKARSKVAATSPKLPPRAIAQGIAQDTEGLGVECLGIEYVGIECVGSLCARFMESAKFCPEVESLSWGQGKGSICGVIFAVTGAVSGVVVGTVVGVALGAAVGDVAGVVPSSAARSPVNCAIVSVIRCLLIRP